MKTEIYDKLAAIRIQHNYGKDNALQFYPEHAEYLSALDLTEPEQFKQEQQRLYQELRNN